MTTTMFTSLTPCARWAVSLAAPRDQLAHTQRAALDLHVAGCPACAAARDDYARMDALLRALPAPRPLAGLPPELTALWAAEDRVALDGTTSDADDDTVNREAAPTVVTLRNPAQRHHLRALTFVRGVAAVLVLGALLGGYYALFAGRGRIGTSTTSDVQTYGPPLDTAALLPHAGPWRMVTLPPGTPDRAQQVAEPGASGGQATGGVTIYEQVAVAGLLYAVAPPVGATPVRIWRSDDAGRSWSVLVLPAAAAALSAGAQTDLGASAADPDTVFFWGFSAGVRSSVRLFSLDRGAHWAPLALPPGSDAWNVALPDAAAGVWYLPVWVDAQPAIWTTRDDGRSWAPHPYPVTLPPRQSDGTTPASGMLLDVRYTAGGILWAYAHTLWWSPDDGETWHALGHWGEQPCDGLIVGTPDLAALYCLFSNGAANSAKTLADRPMWRSDDRGLTWRAIPSGPATPPLATDVTGGTAIPTLLRDGSLLIVAPSRERAGEEALWALRRGANVWHEVSAPLAPPTGYCVPSASGTPSGLPAGGATIAPECASPLQVTVTSGPGATQLVYLTHAPDSYVTNPVYVATLTWS
ncbi:MAG: hypothetical protein ACHQ4H_01315 [Ktedonobacterales bacterium]